MPDSAARREWVTRVLGYQFGAPAAPRPPPLPSPVKAISVWQTAKDAVDDQLRALSDKLRTAGIPTLIAVSDEVETLLSQVRVGLVAALLEYDGAPADPKRRDAALSAIAASSDWLASDARVRAVDTNPFGVTVSARATLGAALRRLQRDVAATAGAEA
jgi:hypothetical protein